MQPLIAITAGEIVNNEYPWAPVVHGQAYTYIDAVVRAGGAPIIVPIVKDKLALRRLYDQSDGLLLSGGNDLDPSCYDAEPSPKTRKTSLARDQQEMQLLKWALEDNKPVLGICRGLQLINVGLGGSLIQDVLVDASESDNHEACLDKKNFQQLVHHLKINPDSRLAEILKTTEISTNSLHHQAIKELGVGLVATAWAEDDVVEAVELPSKKFLIGVQSHPEALESETELKWRRLFEAFVASTKHS